MRHRVTEQDDFRIVGRKARIPVVYTGENPAIAAFHAELPDGIDDRLRTLADLAELREPLAITTNFEEGRADGSRCDYYRAVATTTPSASLPEDLDVLEVGPSTWIVFETEGPFPKALQQLWAEAYGEWFPSNPYRIVPGPEMLAVTGVTDGGRSGRGELWIPVEQTS